MELPICVLVDPTVLQCHEIEVQEVGPLIRLRMAAIPVTATCPACLQPSVRIHSRYKRTLTDLPWANISALIEVSVRRFFCDNPQWRALVGHSGMT